MKLKKMFSKIILISAFLTSALFVGCNKDDDDPVATPSGETIYTSEIQSLKNSAGGNDEVEVVTVKDYGKGTGTITWTSDKVWVLDGFVYVNDGQTLTIEPGTIIKGKAGQGSEASAITVARGGKMIAEGTAEKPIIFTSVSDNLTPEDVLQNGQGGRTIRGSLQNNETGLWGGLSVLGRATINDDDNTDEPGNQENVNGIPETETRALFGGTDDNDNSGIYKYISVRHGGTDIGASNEINGITFAGVGSNTVVENIEAYSNADDGIEIFGGTVSIKNAVIAFAGDDGLDFDSGWRGKVQFLVIFGMGDTGGEHDGGNGDDKTDKPYLDGKVSNVTSIGTLESSSYSSAGKRLMTLRQNTGAKYVNSIFMNYEKTGRIDVSPSLSSDAYTRFLNNECFVKNSIFYNISDVSSVDNGLYIAYSDDDLTGIDNEIAAAQDSINQRLGSADYALEYTDPQFKSFNIDEVDFLVPESSEATSNIYDVSGWGMETVTFKGAIDPNASNPYFSGWSYLGALIQ